MNKFEQGDIVRLKTPQQPADVYGHSGYPSGLRATVDGQTTRIKWGTILKVSSYTNEPVASLDSDPRPLIQKDFINRNERINSMFELVEAAE